MKLLEQLPKPLELQIGNDPEFIKKHAPDADAILCAVATPELVHLAFREAKHLRWMHVLWAGVEKLMFPELVGSSIPLTNGKGVFASGLAEFTLGAIIFFAKEFRRLVHNQEAGKWDQFDVTEVRGQTLGVVGYGEIGRAAATLARAFGMKVVAVRRKVAESACDPLVQQVYPPEQLREMLAVSDYVLVAAPLTPQTQGMIGEAELKAMKSSAVLINVGRGPVVVESALVAALEKNQIKGAALDVFDVEPLPAGHAFYRLPNVLLSPHSADHTHGWVDLAMHCFIANFKHFRNGLPLENIVDKKAGY